MGQRLNYDWTVRTKVNLEQCLEAWYYFAGVPLCDVADHRCSALRYLYSFFSLVDLVTILPLFIDIATGHLHEILQSFQFLRVLRVIRILRLSRVLHYFKNEVTKYTFKAFIVVFTFIIVLAGFYMNIETNPSSVPSGKPLKFHQTVYFLVVTLATVGYGDIYPSTALGQVTITLALSIGAGVLIPYHVSKLMEKLQQDSPFLRNLSSTGVTGHVFYCGEFSFSHFMDFLSEFYHERHGRLKKEVVLLCPNPPDDKLKSLLLHPFYKKRIIYLQGSPLFEQDLERTKLMKADACFIAMPPSWNRGDTDNVLCSYAVKSMNKNLNVFSNLVSSKNKNKAPFLKGTICMEEFRGAILAQSIICPGYNVFFSNLFTSRNIPNIVQVKWLTEYYYGCNNSIFVLKVPDFLVGETLTDVILSMYYGNGSLLIGLFIPTEGVAGRGKFYLNPSGATVITKNMSMAVISHTYFKSSTTSKDMLADQSDRRSTFTYKIAKFFNKLTVPDLHLLNNHDDQHVQQENQLVINESLSTFIRGTASSKTANQQTKQRYVTNQLSAQHKKPITELADQELFELKEEVEEFTQKDLVKNLCLTEYGGDWIALLSDVSQQKTNDPKIDKIQERIKFIIDKHSLLTFTLHGKYNQTKDGSREMKKHMLIVTKSMKGLELLLHHIRLPYVTSIKASNSYSGRVQPIVVLYKEEPEDESWYDTVKTLPLIAFIKGSASNQNDLNKCSARSAETIIITSNPYDQCDTTQIDSFTLMSYVDIVKVNNTAKIITELIHEPNIRFLEKNMKNLGGSKLQSYLQTNKNRDIKPEFFYTPHYASGRVNTYTVLDSLMVQAHYNDDITTIAKELAFGVNGLYQNHHSLGLSNQMTNEDSKCYSRMLKIPSMYHGRTYGELMKNFLQQKNILVVGLFRSKDPMGAPLPYIFTCPHPTTILHENDKVFVFSINDITNEYN
ncbi:calcium-activated BK potassium channel [Heterostelium album PN500]|uniref:Calcium-activated BK potassium channel n=1 Tax=Heterostelium pallidum (strain ATCC 26659 / Pp 5 / PN500) TaxID=670386 RepID=D3BFW1_HETP5|nr:calcium-activated BK potassium channel [Heterostelium album PN500]EFA79721.1 calcium-activated BK potassium channel [Heterostelium album PN500]|eukprot:XP_020431842.1 calcium-activated BK potassium channel [Heterostelium album PN500]